MTCRNGSYRCTVCGCRRQPPRGYKPCTRRAGHDGPCALPPTLWTWVLLHLRWWWQDLFR